jgi:tagatose 1,6-diphosphate aldolase
MKERNICELFIRREDLMTKLSPGKLRGLQQVANARGILTVCAIDHRESLKRELNEKNPEAVSYRQMVDFKLDLVGVAAPFASAVLLDPIYSAGQAIASSILPGHTGLLVSAEKTGYSGDSAARITELLPDWSIRKVKKLGASAVKLLLYFRVDLKEIATKQLDLVDKAANECIEEDIPLLVESVSYPTAEEKDNPVEYFKKKPELVIAAAKKLTALPIDILKSEFPADINYEKDETKLKSYCQELSQVSRLPWVLLSAGTDFVRFRKEVEIACKGGASGFMAGRALWQEATRISSREERLNIFKSQTVSRLKELIQIADKWATPWYIKIGSKDGRFPDLPEGWYKTY